MDNKKKAIIFSIIGIVLVIGIIVGLFLFLNRDKDDDPGGLVVDPNQTIENTETPTPTPPPTPEVTPPRYLDMYETKTLPGVKFNVPKDLLEKGIPAEEVEGSMNGKTVVFETQNSFAIKKIGSFMMGLVPYEKAGVYDSIYVSSITGAKKMQITDDFAFNFDDFNFNSTSFITSRGEGQKIGVISVKMVEPEFTNDVYEGYVLLTVNSQNQGYLAFVVTTGSEIMPVDVQSIINHISLTGDPIQMEIIPPEPETFTLTFDLSSTSGGLIPQNGEVLLRNQETNEILTTYLYEGKGETVVLPGVYDILGTVMVKTAPEAEDQTLRINFENKILTVADNMTVAVELDNQLVETFENPEPKGWLTVSFLAEGTTASVSITDTEGNSVGVMELTADTKSSMLILPTGEYTYGIVVDGDMAIVSGEPVTVSDLGKTDIVIDAGEEITYFTTDAIGVTNIAPVIPET